MTEFSWPTLKAQLEEASRLCGENFTGWNDRVKDLLEQNADLQLKLSLTNGMYDALNQVSNVQMERINKLIEDLATPVPMLLNCPECHMPHIDEGAWATVPHRKHLCDHCHLEWIPSKRRTVGVKELP